MPRSPSPLQHAVIGGLLLLVAAVLAVFKPPGMTRYGQRTSRAAQARRDPVPARAGTGPHDGTDQPPV